MVLGLESSGSRMSNLARQELYFQRFFTLDELVDRIEDVTADQVQSIAREFFNQDDVAITILGSLQGFELTRQDLAC